MKFGRGWWVKLGVGELARGGGGGGVEKGGKEGCWSCRQPWSGDEKSCLLQAGLHQHLFIDKAFNAVLIGRCTSRMNVHDI